MIKMFGEQSNGSPSGRDIGVPSRGTFRRCRGAGRSHERGPAQDRPHPEGSHTDSTRVRSLWDDQLLWRGDPNMPSADVLAKAERLERARRTGLTGSCKLFRRADLKLARQDKLPAGDFVLACGPGPDPRTSPEPSRRHKPPWRSQMDTKGAVKQELQEGFVRDGMSLSLTFAETGESGPSLPKYGRPHHAAEGLTLADLKQANKAFATAGYESRFIDLREEAFGHLQGLAAADMPPSDLQPHVLVVKDGLAHLLRDSPFSRTYLTSVLLQERPDDKSIGNEGQVNTKRARWNIGIGDAAVAPSSAVEEAKGQVRSKIMSMHEAPWDVFEVLRRNLGGLFDAGKWEDLVAEANIYYNVQLCGIGFHGDTERRVVICARLMSDSPMKFAWFKDNKPVGDVVSVKVDSGDLYFMEDFAVGSEWAGARTIFGQQLRLPAGVGAGGSWHVKREHLRAALLAADPAGERPDDATLRRVLEAGGSEDIKTFLEKHPRFTIHNPHYAFLQPLLKSWQAVETAAASAAKDPANSRPNWNVRHATGCPSYTEGALLDKWSKRLSVEATKLADTPHNVFKRLPTRLKAWRDDNDKSRPGWEAKTWKRMQDIDMADAARKVLLGGDSAQPPDWQKLNLGFYPKGERTEAVLQPRLERTVGLQVALRNKPLPEARSLASKKVRASVLRHADTIAHKLATKSHRQGKLRAKGLLVQEHLDALLGRAAQGEAPSDEPNDASSGED